MTQIHTHATLKLAKRHRRLRTSAMMRALVQETRLSPDMFVLPLFVCEGENVRREVPSMPGVYNLSVDETVLEVERAKSDGIRSVLLFGIPARKDDIGSLAYDPEAPVQSAIRAIKQQVPDVLVITDVCLCEYTDHGHCGIVIDDEIVNDPSVEQLVRAAVSHAAAGADIVAPSDMMDGRVGAIREALDARGFEHTAIMSYAAKYCSAFYGPFRDAAGSTPQFGDRRTVLPCTGCRPPDPGLRVRPQGLDAQAPLQAVDRIGLALGERADDRGGFLDRRQVGGRNAALGLQLAGPKRVDIAERAGGRRACAFGRGQRLLGRDPALAARGARRGREPLGLGRERTKSGLAASRMGDKLFEARGQRGRDGPAIDRCRDGQARVDRFRGSRLERRGRADAGAGADDRSRKGREDGPFPHCPKLYGRGQGLAIGKACLIAGSTLCRALRSLEHARP